MRKIAKILGIENLGFGIRETTLCAAHIFHFLFSLKVFLEFLRLPISLSSVRLITTRGVKI